MLKQSRRFFLKTIVGLGAGLLAPRQTWGRIRRPLSDDRMGMLFDTTLCVGCRYCEWACKKANGLPSKTLDTYENAIDIRPNRRPDENTLTVVNSDSPSPNNRPQFLKVQCMHCDYPACASSCIVGAITKQDNGAVTWDTNKCIGCRYCMVACPFQIPAFEYNKALEPDIKKCTFCFPLISQGKSPACAEICPVEAILFGPRSELIKVARKRIGQNPGKYINHIYGEQEVGGTSVLYLSDREFKSWGLPTLGSKPAPGVTEAIQHGLFAYFVPPAALYALLGGLMWITRRRESQENVDQ